MGNAMRKRKVRTTAVSITNNNISTIAQPRFNRPIKPTCFEPLTRVPSWPLVNFQVPWRIQLLQGSSLEYSLLGHTSLLFLPFRASLHLWQRSIAAAPSNVNTFSLLG